MGGLGQDTYSEVFVTIGDAIKWFSFNCSPRVGAVKERQPLVVWLTTSWRPLGVLYQLGGPHIKPNNVCVYRREHLKGGSSLSSRAMEKGRGMKL